MLAEQVGGTSDSRSVELKPRIFVLTDIAPITIEPDDMQSLIRLLAHADLFEIEGLIASTGWSNMGGSEHPEIIQQIIDAYEKDLPNLQKRSDQTEFKKDEEKQLIGYWPSPNYLRSRTMLGSRTMGHAALGENNHSPGSELLIKLAEDDDDRPIWVLAWGGGNTLSQAIWSLQKETTPERLNRFFAKVRFYMITDQDRAQRTPYDISSQHWLRQSFKNHLRILWDESAWIYQNNTGKAHWDSYAADIQPRGHLGALYPKYKYGVEGDTPSFLYVLPNGLNDPEYPGHGGWGGYFEWGLGPDKNTETFVNQAGTAAYEVTRKYGQRFYSAIYNNFAARMDWVQHGKGNRNPVVMINNDASHSALHLSPTAGTTLELDASNSSDPENDPLTFSWWILKEAGSYKNEIVIAGDNDNRASIKIPADAVGKEFHVICEITDGGQPNLTSYRRIIVKPLVR